MSEYKFKNLSEIDTVAEPAEGTTMMGFENGVPIQMPMSAVKGSGNVFIISPDDPEYSITDTAYGNKIKKELLSGKMVWMYGYSPASTTKNSINYEAYIYENVMGFVITEDTKGHIIILFGGSGDSSRSTFRITVD